MTTAERINAVAKTFAGRNDLGFSSTADLQNLIITELGHVEILDHPVIRGGVPFMANAPQSIYHICASNLSVSAETSLVLGLLLGSKLYFKLPCSGLPRFTETVRNLPAALRDKVTLLNEHNTELFSQADTVVVYGSDETVETVFRQTSWRQRFLGYGHKISLGLIDSGDETESIAAAAAREILAYEQMGCLSPQAYLCRDPQSCEKFSILLAAALAEHRKTQPMPALGFDEAALRQHFIQSAAARGEKVLTGANKEYVIINGAKKLEIGPGNVAVSVLASWQLSDAERWKGKLSAISSSRSLSPEFVDYFTMLGVSRICKTGELQSPPLLWYHDSRPRLADMVRWVTLD